MHRNTVRLMRIGAEGRRARERASAERAAAQRLKRREYRRQWEARQAAKAKEASS